jgi:hypothetical protein
MDPDPLEPPRIGIEHLEFKAVGALDQFATRRHPARDTDDQPAKRVDILGLDRKSVV